MQVMNNALMLVGVGVGFHWRFLLNNNDFVLWLVLWVVHFNTRYAISFVWLIKDFIEIVISSTLIVVNLRISAYVNFISFKVLIITMYGQGWKYAESG